MIFVSHKHSDREIAETLGRFIRDRSAGNVRVHLSSSPDFEGPRFGQPLNAELKRALAESDLVILVYTTDTEDWSYCMWECGVATDPTDEHPTSVVVVQCTSDEPTPFGDQLRVDARNLESVQAFVKSLLTTTDLFSRRDAAITGFSAESRDVQDFAAELHTKFADVLPSGTGAEGSTPTAPYLRVRLDDQAAEDIRASYLAGDAEQSLKILGSTAVIAENVGAGNLFGMRLSPESTLGDVLADWRNDDINSGEEPRWFASLAEQIEAALVGKLRPVKWAPYQTAKGRADVPYVAASRQVAAGVEFDVYMLPIVPRPILVGKRMLVIDEMYHKDVANEPLEEIPLAALVKEMNERKKTRLPILDGQAPVSIVHKATINEFLANRALDTGSVEGLTLADLMTARADTLEGSYVEVIPEATIDEAMEAMNASRGCQDVYVTQDSVVMGWLTNVMFIED
jgi:CBS domain-containing protein